MEVSGQLHVFASFTLGKKLQVPIEKRGWASPTADLYAWQKKRISSVGNQPYTSVVHLVARQVSSRAELFWFQSDVASI
jgi:hypothetical protein